MPALPASAAKVCPRTATSRSRHALRSRADFATPMGRAGIEPATLGLKVRPELLRRVAVSGRWLQRVGFIAATSCKELRVAERSRYSNPYSSLLLGEATYQYGLLVNAGVVATQSMGDLGLVQTGDRFEPADFAACLLPGYPPRGRLFALSPAF